MVLVAWAAPARADYEETEQRLKAAGVSDELRKRVHAAIDGAVEFLLRRQLENGSWPTPKVDHLHPPEAATVYAALALRHAGTPAARRGAKAALRWLIPKDGEGRWRLHHDIYIAGPMVMLLCADKSHAEVGRRIAGWIAKGQDERTGWWGYYTGYKGRQEMVARGDLANLSTTQFAGLGLWAGDRIGARTPFLTWREHLRALCRYQLPTGSWSYAPRYVEGKVAARTIDGYPNGTFMGAANFMLALSAVGDRLRIEPELKERVAITRTRALQALHRDGRAVLGSLRGNPFGKGWSYTGWSYYGLYALEKAALFWNLKELGGVPWYQTGAEVLLDIQNEDGGWGRARVPTSRTRWVAKSDTISSCFALLFLLRSSRTYHPTTPRDVDAKKGPATGKGPSKPEAKPPPRIPAPAPKPLPVEVADELIEKLERALRRRGTDKDEIVRMLRELGKAWPRVQDEDWRARASKLLVSALVTVQVVRASELNYREDVNVEAAKLLAQFQPPVSKEVRRALPLKTRDYRPSERFWDAAFSVVVVLRDRQSFVWLTEEVLSADPRFLGRTRAALRALHAFDGAPGRLRLEAVKRLIRMFEGAENRARDDSKSAFWEAIGADVMRTLRHLCIDPATGRGPVLDRAAAATISDYRRWLTDHKDPNRPPWR